MAFYTLGVGVELGYLLIHHTLCFPIQSALNPLPRTISTNFQVSLFEHLLPEVYSLESSTTTTTTTAAV